MTDQIVYFNGSQLEFVWQKYQKPVPITLCVVSPRAYTIKQMLGGSKKVTLLILLRRLIYKFRVKTWTINLN